jgi:hypothetical protein
MTRDAELEAVLATVREAEALAASVRRQIEDDDAALRKMGVDVDKLAALDPGDLPPAERHKLAEAMQQDLAEAQAAARDAHESRDTPRAAALPRHVRKMV